MEPVPRAKRFGNPWGLAPFGIGYQYAVIKVNKYLCNGKELIEECGIMITGRGCIACPESKANRECEYWEVECGGSDGRADAETFSL